MRKYSKFIALLGILAFVLMFFLAFPGHASTNTLPAAVGGTVMVNSNGFVSAPTGFYASNGLALVNPPILIYDETFSGWGTADGITWTNAGGWTSTAVVTNGTCNLANNSLLSPLITWRGIAGISETWASLVSLQGVVEYTTNDADWVQLTTLSDLRISANGYRLRFTAETTVPGFGTNTALLDRVMIWGHQFPARIGATNDFAGVVTEVDDPIGNRDAVNLQTLDNRIAAVMVSALSPSTWAAHQAIQAVNLAGQALNLDPRYTLAVSNDTLSLTFGGQPVWDVIGGGVVYPQITYFALTGTQATLRVTGSSGWRPYPQWTSDAGFTNWMTLTTNQFSSSYPNLTNGQYTLSFPAVTNSPAFYRVSASNETGSTGTVMAIHVPLQVDGQITGEGMSGYARTGDVTAINALLPGYATTGSVATLSGTVAGVSAQMGTKASTGAVAAVSNMVLALHSVNHATNSDYAALSGTASNGIIDGVSTPFGTAAATDSTNFSPAQWRMIINQITNLVVSSTNGVNYNGPPIGTIYMLDNILGRTETWYNTNSSPPSTIYLDTEGSWGACNHSPESSYFSATNRLGPYTGITFQAYHGTGTFYIAELGSRQTNWVSYLDGGTATLARISGPATNQFAPPAPAVTWSGFITNIMGGITNVLEFVRGYAVTNRVLQ